MYDTIAYTLFTCAQKADEQPA